jgi:hypothetical protein
MPIVESLMTSSQARSTITKKQQESSDLTRLINDSGKGASLSSLSDPSKAIKSKLAVKKTEYYLEATKSIAEKNNQISKIVSKTSDYMTAFRQELLSVRSSKNIANTQFSTNLSKILSEIEGILKDPIMGGASELYSNQSVDFSLLTSVSTAGTPDYSYCLGAETGTNVDIDLTGTTYDISGMTAKNPMFEEFIRSVRLAQQGNPSDPSDVYFQQAMDLLDSAQTKATQNLQSLTFVQQMLTDKISVMTDSQQRNQELYEELAIRDVSELVMERAMVNNDLSTLMNNDVVYLQLLQRIMQLSQRLF